MIKYGLSQRAFLPIVFLNFTSVRTDVSLSCANSRIEACSIYNPGMPVLLIQARRFYHLCMPVMYFRHTSPVHGADKSIQRMTRQLWSIQKSIDCYHHIKSPSTAKMISFYVTSLQKSQVTKVSFPVANPSNYECDSVTLSHVSNVSNVKFTMPGRKFSALDSEVYL